MGPAPQQVDIAILAIEREAASPSVEALLREVAASGVVHEAEPPGIDYVTVQIDMDTWAALARLHPTDDAP